MYKFIFEDAEKEQNSIFDPYHTERIEFQVRDNSSLDEMLDAFENFLKANGYHFDGNVDIVPEDNFDDTVREPVFEKGYPSFEAVNSKKKLWDATPEEWNEAYKNVTVKFNGQKIE